MKEVILNLLNQILGRVAIKSDRDGVSPFTVVAKAIQQDGKIPILAGRDRQANNDASNRKPAASDDVLKIGAMVFFHRQDMLRMHMEKKAPTLLVQ